MKLARKVFNRLRREFRHEAAYTKASLSKKGCDPEDLLSAWTSKDRHLTVEQCVQEWRTSRPMLFRSDLRMPLNPATVCDEADAILKGRIQIFESSCDARMPGIWSEDPLTRKTWPMDVHFTRFNVFHPLKDGRTDIRRLWEAGRFGWALPLARASLVRNDLKYAEVWSKYIRNFIDQNPPEYGPHWLNAMEVGIRAVQWCRAMAIFLSIEGAQKFWNSKESVLPLFLSSLLAHGRFIRSHLEWTPHGRTNHYLANLVGLLAISIFVPQFKESEKWRKFAKKALNREVRAQTNADGLHGEASTAYHHLVVELYALVAAMDRLHRFHFSQAFYQKLFDIRDADIIVRGGENLDPRIGDDDSGSLLIPDSLITSLEKQPRSPLVTFKQKTGSHAFRKSGIYILRSKTLSCHVSCGPNGQQGVGGHAHNDKLSIVVRCQGVPIIVDPGTFCYSADIRARDRFRSTAMHSTIMLDEHEQNPLKDWRKLTDQTKARCQIWKDSPEEAFFMGEHQGYKKLGAIHRRSIQLNKNLGKLFILDEVDTKDKHVMDFYLHLAPGFPREKVRISEKEVFLPAIKIVFASAVDAELVESAYSPVYGKQVPSLSLHVRQEFRGPLKFRWEIHEIVSK